MATPRCPHKPYRRAPVEPGQRHRNGLIRFFKALSSSNVILKINDKLSVFVANCFVEKNKRFLQNAPQEILAKRFVLVNQRKKCYY